TQHASWREYARAAPATSSRRLRRAVPNDRPAPRPREGTRRTSFVSAPWTSSSSRTDRREAEQLYTALRAKGKKARTRRRARLTAAGRHRSPRPCPLASVHGRDAELRSILDARRPARGHCLGARVKADRVRAVLVEVAEAGALPAAEGVIGDRHRDRHVDADHADLDAAGEVARRVAVAREDRDAVPVFMVVTEAERFRIVVRAHDRQHGAKNLFLVDAHVLGDMVEEAAAHVEAALVALHLEAAPVDDEFRALADAEIDVAEHFVERRLGDERPEVSGGVGRGTDLQRLDARDHAPDELVGGLLADRYRD